MALAERAAEIILSTIEKNFLDHFSTLRTLKLVLFDQPTVDISLKAWQTKWGGLP